jgi:hypothetical protein
MRPGNGVAGTGTPGRRPNADDAPDLPFHAKLQVDEEGVVQRYGSLWRLVSG